MWFRNALVYRITQDLALTAESLEEALMQKPARACANQETHTLGFMAPLGKHSVNLVHKAGDALMIAMRKEEKILPGAVVKDALAEKIDEIEARDGRKVYKKERDTLKDEIIMSLLPRAFVRKNTTFAVIDIVAGLIYVDSPTASKAEDLLSLVREVLGSLPVRPVTVKSIPYSVMTAWVKEGKAHGEFKIADQAVLMDAGEDGGKIAATRQDLSSDEIQNHISSGKQVTQLAMGWEDKISFTLDDRMTIKSIRFSDLIQDEAQEKGGDDMLAQIDSAISIMTLTLRDFFPALFEALGGEDTPQGI